MIVKSLIQEHAQKRSQAAAQAAATKDYSEVLRLMQEYATRVKNLLLPQDEIAAELAEIAKNPCRENNDLWITAAQFHPSPKYLESLCAILESEDECVWHEGIVDILYDLKDERSIPSLKKALTYNRSDDPTRELAVKILETLANIGSPESRELLKNCLESSSPRIREVAEILLTED